MLINLRLLFVPLVR